MAAVRVNLTIEVEQKGNGLAIQRPVPIQLVHDRKRWRVACKEPSVELDGFNSMEEAILAGARMVGDEVQAAVLERPLIVGRITPEMIPHHMM